MNSTFLVFDLVGGDTRSKRKCDTQSIVHPKLDDRESIPLTEYFPFRVRTPNQPAFLAWLRTVAEAIRVRQAKLRRSS